MNSSRFNSGFTLVELAIALMVIGLLIAGVLKGQELVENARVTQMVRQMDSYQTAMLSFQSIYSAVPGDMQNPGNRIVGCNVSPCNLSGDNGGTVGVTSTTGFNAISTVLAAENRIFWVHLAKAGLITGMNADYSGTPLEAGVDYPQTPFKGFFQIQHQNATSPVGINAGTRRGHYLISNLIFNTHSAATTNHVLTCPIAVQIDRKMDDGLPRSGDVRAISSSSYVHCLLTDGAGDYVYDETDSAKTTNVAFRLSK